MKKATDTAHFLIGFADNYHYHSTRGVQTVSIEVWLLVLPLVANMLFKNCVQNLNDLWWRRQTQLFATKNNPVRDYARSCFY